MRLRQTPIALGLSLAMLASVAGGAQEVRASPALARRLYSDLHLLFGRHYPKATCHLLAERIHCEYDTRVFIVHTQSKTGEWQDPSEVRGPNRNGILCDIEVVKGKYEGAAGVPQTLDERYFKVLLMAPSVPGQDTYFYVRLSYPDGVNTDFLSEFTGLVEGRPKGKK